MQRRLFGGAVSLAVAATLGCRAAEPPDWAEGASARAAAVALERARPCTDELARMAAEDPPAVARALEVEPIRLAPHGGPSAGPLRAEIAERLESARADAAAAAKLARVRDEAMPLGAAEQRALRSIKTSGDLCRSADALRQERLARSR
jgi:hypothetical protein